MGSRDLKRSSNPNSACDMGGWTRDGMRVATCLFEAAAWHYAVRPVCRCGHGATFNPHGLWWHFQKKMWDDRLKPAREHFWCRRCSLQHRKRVRPVRLELVRQSAGDIELTFPPEREWKRAISRFRS